MGQQTKFKKDWEDTTLQVIVDAVNVYTHTVKIMSNEKYFHPGRDYQFHTMDSIQANALDTYLWAWTANRINVPKNPQLAYHRLDLQRQALEACLRLQALSRLAKVQFHLPSTKFWYWAELIDSLYNKLGAWHKSDVQRYGKLAATGDSRYAELAEVLAALPPPKNNLQTEGAPPADNVEGTPKSQDGRRLNVNASGIQRVAAVAEYGLLVL